MGQSESEIEKFLASVQPFKSLDKKDLHEIVSKTAAKTFSKEESIFNEGESADSVWVLYKGRVRIFKYTSGGRPFAIETIVPGELFGTLCRLGGNGRSYPCTAIAASPTVAFRILDRTFLEYYMKRPAMVRGVCALCSDRLKDVQDLRCMGQESVAVRVASILARLYQVHGELIPFTKKEIAELIGTTQESAFRALADLQKNGTLASSYRKIFLKKPEELKKIVESI